MTPEEKRQRLAQADSEILLFDGFGEALIGTVFRFGMPPVALYDRGKCIEILMQRDGLSHEDAEEYFCFNVEGAWIGERTPAFCELLGSPHEPTGPLVRDTNGAGGEGSFDDF